MTDVNHQPPADNNSDDSDEWAVDELPIIVGKTVSKDDNDNNGSAPSIMSQAFYNSNNDESVWEEKLPLPLSSCVSSTTPINTGEVVTPVQKDEDNEGFPMILVDMTQLSNGDIHNRFDANAVNDPVAVKKLRLTIENEYYVNYYKDSNLIANGTIIVCGSSVWRPALEQLRKERVGHYFCPIFPPKRLS